MDAIHERGLRSAGARLGDVNRGEWQQLLKQKPLAELMWATSKARSQSKYSTVTPAEVAAVLMVAVPKACEVLPPPTTESKPHVSIEKPMPSVSCEIQYLTAISEHGPLTNAELARKVGKTQANTSMWLSTHTSLIVKKPDLSLGHSRSLISLSEKGRVSAMALGIEVKPRETIPADVGTNTGIPKTIPATAETTLPQRETPILENRAVVHQQKLWPPPAPPKLEKTPDHVAQAFAAATTAVAQAEPAPIPAPVRKYPPGSLQDHLVELLDAYTEENGFAATLMELRTFQARMGLV